MTIPQYNDVILLLPLHIVMSGFHCILILFILYFCFSFLSIFGLYCKNTGVSDLEVCCKQLCKRTQRNW